MFPMSKIVEGRRYKLQHGRTVTVIRKSGRGRNRHVETDPPIGPAIQPGHPSLFIHVRALAYKILGELDAPSPCCQHCGESFPRSVVDDLGGEIPIHDFPRPCRAVCPGSRKLPRVEQEALGKDLF
jgi:hypothetical protein